MNAACVLMLTVSHGYTLREELDNPLLPATVSFADAHAAFLALSPCALTRLVSVAERGDSRARVMTGVLWRFCSILLSASAASDMCAASHTANCSCGALAEASWQAAHDGGNVEAAQAIASQNWIAEYSRQRHVRLLAAADGIRQSVETQPAELPAVTMPATGSDCTALAELLLPLAVSVDGNAGPKAAEVPISLRRLETRWHGLDPKDQVVEEHLGAAEMGMAWAVRTRGYYALTDGVEANVSAALSDFEATAEAGDAYAVFNLGYMHWTGTGVEKNVTRALEYFVTAAAAGVAPALNALGVAYFNGLGTERDVERALHYLREAVALGDPEAMTNLAAFILGGEDVALTAGLRHQGLTEAGLAEGLELLESSALRGRRGALLLLGSILVGRPRTFIAEGPHGDAIDCPRGVALLRLLLELWGGCAGWLAMGLKAYKAGHSVGSLMSYLHAAALGSATGMANAAHLLLKLSDEEAAFLPRPHGRHALARSLLHEAHELGNTDASLSLADLLYDEATAAEAASAKAVGAVPAHGEADESGPAEEPAGDEVQAAGGRPGAAEGAGEIGSAQKGAPVDSVAAGKEETCGSPARVPPSGSAPLYREALALYTHVVNTVNDPEALYALGHMHQHGLGTPRDLDRAEARFIELRDMGGTEVLPGVLAQVGVNLHRASDWLADMTGWW